MENAKVWGVATSKTERITREIILGRNFNQIETRGGLIRINSKEYKYERISENSFKLFQ
ncbi:MAG: hypothetical protein ABR595_10555 [Psychroflexus sp.]